MSALLELPELIRGRVERNDAGCLVWTKNKVSGYGQVWVPELKRLRLVHHISFEAAYGLIPDRHDVGHLCHDQDASCPGGECAHRGCCDPQHLEAQTRTQNNLGGRLGDVQRARHALVTRCPAGHPYDAANTYIRHDRPASGRMCRACSRERTRQRREDMRDTGEIKGEGQ